MNRTPLDGRLAKVREAGRMLDCLWMTEVERERRAGDSGRSSEWKIHPRSLRITSPLKNHRIDSPLALSSSLSLAFDSTSEAGLKH